MEKCRKNVVNKQRKTTKEISERATEKTAEETRE
jgi:hypothetical protein